VTDPLRQYRLQALREIAFWTVMFILFLCVMVLIGWLAGCVPGDEGGRTQPHAKPQTQGSML
jgi:hypothetical protein